MSIWSRWFKKKDPLVKTQASIIEPIAKPQPVVSVATQPRLPVLPIEWSDDEQAAVIQSWSLLWQQAQSQAEQWMLDQQARSPEKLQAFAVSAITQVHSNEMRQRLLDFIDDASLLKSLLPLFKNKDKSIYKRLKTLVAPEPVAKAAPVVSIVQSVEVSVLPTVEIQQPVIEVDTTDYAAASVQFQQTLNLYQAFSELSAHHQQALTTLLTQWRDAQQRATQASEPTSEQLRFLQDFQRVQQLADAVTRWLGSCEVLQQLCQPIKDEVSLTQLQNHYAKLEKLMTQLQWPLAGDRLMLLTQAKKQLKKLPVMIEAHQQSLQQAEQNWQQQLPLVEQLLQAGDLGAAEQALRVLQKAASVLTLKPRQQQQLQKFSQQLFELKDWQGFAELPKKQQLITDMQQLITTPLPVEQQAERIKHLQAQWQLLNIHEHHALWQQFKTLAEQAYLPCQQFYAQQKQQRLQNAETRQLLCAQLEQYVAEHDWAQANWGKVKHTLQLAKQNWRAAFPVERKLAADLQKRFDLVMAQIQNKIDQHQQQEIERRQQLQQQRERKAQQRQQQLELAAQKKQQEQERQEKIKAQKLAQLQKQQQLDADYLQRLQNHVSSEIMAADDHAGRQRLVIQLEILAGLPSPPAEQALRMQVQVARLAKNFQAAESKLAAHHQCVENWCQLPAVVNDDAQAQALLQRMMAAYQACLREGVVNEA
jgi:hypothetical protein